jgi:hypothetical protein
MMPRTPSKPVAELPVSTTTTIATSATSIAHTDKTTGGTDDTTIAMTTAIVIGYMLAFGKSMKDAKFP